MFSIILSFGILVVLPAVLIWGIWKALFKSKLEWLLDVLATTAVVAWVFQSGNWSWIGTYWRFLWIPLLIFAVITSWKKVRTLPFRIKYNGNQQINLGMNTLLLIVFGAYNAFVFISYSTNEQALDLAFPLQEGSYYIGHSGDSVQMNYHHAYEPQKYALDIIGLNKLGTRAKGLYPKDLEKYEIYSHGLYSPCDGTVIET